MNDVTVHTSGWEMDRRPVDVVVISSQLAYGSVGNTASARVLTQAGCRCVQVPTVILGTLPHYPDLHGGPLPDEWFSGMLDDMLALDALTAVRYVLVGYLAHPGQARLIAEWFLQLRKRVPEVKLIVDPAMGDDDVGLYTDPAVAASYADQLLPLATGLTPNRFELALLSDRDVATAGEMTAAAEAIRPADGWVIVTSAAHGPATGATVRNLVVSRDGSDVVENERLETSAKGAGDIYAATVVSGLLASQPLIEAAEHAGLAVADAIREAQRVGG